jgi:hypothetical protein
VLFPKYYEVDQIEEEETSQIRSTQRREDKCTQNVSWKIGRGRPHRRLSVYRNAIIKCSLNNLFKSISVCFSDTQVN